uniref:Uncharacterized protein n=1 Tax=Anguilla anguilla TaxID=7936 RepID=A0A0E9UWL9_ANGAN
MLLHPQLESSCSGPLIIQVIQTTTFQNK